MIKRYHISIIKKVSDMRDRIKYLIRVYETEQRKRKAEKLLARYSQGKPRSRDRGFHRVACTGKAAPEQEELHKEKETQR